MSFDKIFKNKYFQKTILALLIAFGVHSALWTTPMWTIWAFFHDLRLSIVKTNAFSGDIIIVDLPPTGADYVFDTKQNPPPLIDHVELIKKISPAANTILYTFFLPRFNKAKDFQYLKNNLYKFENLIITMDDPHYGERMNTFMSDQEYTNYDFYYYPFTRDIHAYAQDDRTRRGIWDHHGILGKHSYKSIIQRKYPDIKRLDGLITIKTGKDLNLGTGQRQFFFRYRSKAFNRINYVDIIKSDFNLDILKDKFVIIGYNKMNELRYSKKLRYFNEASLSYSSIPLDELIANMLESLILNDYAKLTDEKTNRIFSFLSLILFCLLFILSKPFWAAIYAIAFPFLLFIIGTLIFAANTWMINVSHPIVGCFVIGFLGLPYLFVKQVRNQEKEIAKNKLALAEAKIVAKSAKADMGFKLALKLAHDIRSPLGALSTVSKLTQNGWKPEFGTLLTNSIERIERISNEMLAKYRSGFEDIKNTDEGCEINQTTKALIDNYKGTWSNVSFYLVLPNYPIYINMPQADFERTITNLITNSIEAMSGSGRIEIYLVESEQDLYLSIQDSGPGIPKELHSKLFQEKMTTKGDKGHGIGLHESKKIFQKYGGDLKFVDSPTGAKFNAHFLRQSDPVNEIKIYRKVIVLEDAKGMRDLWVSTLERLGCEVVSFPDPEIFITYMLKNKNLYLNSSWTLISDLIFDGYEKTGFDVFSDYKGKAQLILCTSLSDNIQIQNLCKGYGATLLGKDVFHKTRIEVM